MQPSFARSWQKPNHGWRRAKHGFHGRVVGEPQPSRAPGMPAGRELPRLGRPGDGRLQHLEAAREQMVDRVIGASERRARNARSSSSKTGDVRGRRLKSPPSTSGSPAGARERALRRRSGRPARPAARLPADACRLADAQLRAAGRAAAANAIRRRSRRPRSRKRVQQQRRARSAIRHGGRTSVMFEPPSHEPIRSGFQRAEPPAQRRELVARRQHAMRLGAAALGERLGPRAAAPPAAGRSTTCRPRAAPRTRPAATGSPGRASRCAPSRAAAATATCEGAGSGGWSRPWNRFQVRTASSAPGRAIQLPTRISM